MTKNNSGHEFPACAWNLIRQAGILSQRCNLWFGVAVVATIGMLGSSELLADDAASLVRRANTELREGNTEQALADYREAVEAQPDRFEPLYNQAVAYYRMGQFAEARELFTQVLATSDPKLEAKARFNLANCDYSEAVASAEQDRQAAIERLTKAISHYRGALRADRSDTDSRANIELAKMLIDQLKEEEKQEQEQQQQKQDQQQNQDQQNNDDQQDSSKNDQNQQNQDNSQQNDDSQQNKEPQDQSESKQDKSDDQKQSDESKQDEGKGDNKENDQEQKDKGDQKGKGDQKDKGDEGQEKDKQSGNADSQDKPENEQPQKEGSAGEQEDQKQSESNEQNQPNPSEGEQEEPKQNPSNAQAGEPQGESDGQPTGGHVQEMSEAEARPMTQEEAQKMLQAVRDRDMMRRYEKLRQMQRLQVPVDRDW